MSDQRKLHRMTSGTSPFIIVLGTRWEAGGSGVHMQMETSSKHAAAIVDSFPSQTSDVTRS